MTDVAGRVLTPPEGWLHFGTHADDDFCSVPGSLTWSDETGEDGLPMWERHDGCLPTPPARTTS